MPPPKIPILPPVTPQSTNLVQVDQVHLILAIILDDGAALLLLDTLVSTISQHEMTIMHGLGTAKLTSERRAGGRRNPSDDVLAKC